MKPPYFVVNETGCWNWTACVMPDGYGNIMIQKRNYKAHRWVWAQLRGPLPRSLVLHHRCENRSCVNPEHLEPLTHSAHLKLHEALRKTCGHGHPWTPENTGVRPNGKRRCRQCHRDQERRRRERRASEQSA